MISRPQHQNKEPVLYYSNQLETTLFAEDSEITPNLKRRIIKRSSKPALSVSKRKKNGIIEPLLNHKLLSKEDEYELCNKIKIMTKLRNEISTIIIKREGVMHSSSSKSDILVEECSRLYGNAGDMQLSLITDHDIKHRLKLKNRNELNQILQEGSNARQTLIQCNMKYVLTIAKRWLRNYARTDSQKLFSTDQPDAITLDDLIQEGVLGLSRAIDKFDTSHDVRFTTYATHWITSHVRTAVKNAKYGCLRIPSGLQALRSSYIAIVKPYYDSGQPIPSKDEIALQLGVSERRLQTALAVTKPLLSIDAPLGSKLNNQPNSADGSTAGLTLMDTLICPESCKTEQRVEISFLRQYLENAMSAELSPHERDVIRLRLGLDDGITKTVKEVVDVCGGAVSSYDIRSVEKRAFQKLRSPNSMFTSYLLEFVDDEILGSIGANTGSSIASTTTIAA